MIKKEGLIDAVIRSKSQNTEHGFSAWPWKTRGDEILAIVHDLTQRANDTEIEIRFRRFQDGGFFTETATETLHLVRS